MTETFETAVDAGYSEAISQDYQTSPPEPSAAEAERLQAEEDANTPEPICLPDDDFPSLPFLQSFDEEEEDDCEDEDFDEDCNED